jgi:hypothetical protein
MGDLNPPRRGALSVRGRNPRHPLVPEATGPPAGRVGVSLPGTAARPDAEARPDSII